MSKLIKTYTMIQFSPCNNHIVLAVYRKVKGTPADFTHHNYKDISASSANRIQYLLNKYHGFVSFRNLPIISISFYPIETKENKR